MDKEKILKNINSIISGVLIIVCFLPMFKLNASDAGYANNLTASGFETATGLTFSDGTEMGINIAAFFLFLFPLLLILSNYIEKLKEWKKYCIFISPIGSIAFVIITKFSVAAKMNVSIATSIGFWIYLIVSVVLLVLGYLQFKSIELNKEEIKNFVGQSSAKFMDASQGLMKATNCPACGSKVLKGKNFCPKCGTAMPKEELKKTCVNCGSEIPIGKKFCPDCGTPVPEEKKEEQPRPMKCVSCGSEIPVGKKFCPDCGTPVQGE